MAELFDQREAEIVRLFEEGGTFRSVAAALGISTATIREMLRDPERVEFQTQYARAREDQAHTFADEIIDIASDTTLTPEDKRIQIDARKWAAGKRKPTVYGDITKIDLNGKTSSDVTLRVKWDDGSDDSNPLPT